MAQGRTEVGISRRRLLVGGGAGVGLALAWALWPRSYAPNLRSAPGETALNAFLKIGKDGRVIVAVPQVELGQGVWTSLPQILADELGADWRTVAVEPAPVHPLYANDLLAEEVAAGELPSAFHGIGRWAAREYATRTALMLTGGSTSVRAFEPRLREAGAAARALLIRAAAERWGIDPEGLDTSAGFVVAGDDRLPFAELSEAAADHELPEILPMRGGIDNRLAGQSLPRLDLPAKVDGSFRFAGDVRLPDMLYASVRQGPIGDSRLVRSDRSAAARMAGVVATFAKPRWVGAAATSWWAADRAATAMKPVFETPAPMVSSTSIRAALRAALDEGDATPVFESGDADAAFASGSVVRAHYAAGVAANAPVETLTATARLTGDRLEVWAPVQAPGLARAAAARAAAMAEEQVTLYAMPAGGGYGRKLETAAVEQAVEMALELKRPVQLVWSRSEETMQDSFRPPALATIEARVAGGGNLLGWRARIAAPATMSQVSARLRSGEAGDAAGADASAVAGAVPPYGIPAIAVEHAPADVGLRTGIWRSGAHSYTAFFTESFIDEVARMASLDPFSFRMQMLGGNPRLARCLSTAAALGGWDGGAAGSNMGIAAHQAFGSYVATLVEIAVDAGRLRVLRAVSAVDCGRAVNPEIVRQLVEGGIVHGIGGATGQRIEFERGLPSARSLADLALPRLADSPEITVELLDSQEPPGGVTELGVPTVAPAIANALHAFTGERLRMIPFVVGTGS